MSIHALRTLVAVLKDEKRTDGVDVYKVFEEINDLKEEIDFYLQRLQNIEENQEERVERTEKKLRQLYIRYLTILPDCMDFGCDQNGIERGAGLDKIKEKIIKLTESLKEESDLGVGLEYFEKVTSIFMDESIDDVSSVNIRRCKEAIENYGESEE